MHSDNDDLDRRKEMFKEFSTFMRILMAISVGGFFGELIKLFLGGQP